MPFTYLDRSGKARKFKVNGWRDGFREGHWGRYGSWTFLNVSPDKLEEVITDEAVYQGDGFFYGWHIRFG
jgi:hypothetical protein